MANNRNNKSEQSKRQSEERKRKQALRGAKQFQEGSNVHNGASLSQSGQPKKK